MVYNINLNNYINLNNDINNKDNIKKRKINENDNEINNYNNLYTPKLELYENKSKIYFNDIEIITIKNKITNGTYGNIHDCDLSNNINKFQIEIENNNNNITFYYNNLNFKNYIVKIQKLNKLSLNELAILKNFKNINYLIQLKSYIIDKNSNLLFLILEKGNDDLFNLITNKSTDNNTKNKLIIQMSHALKNLHDKDIVHLDLKLDNFILDSNNNIKIIDFGLSRYVPNNKKISCKVGTMHYVAPEIFNNSCYDPKKADVWSLGVCIYNLLKEIFPFHQNYVNNLNKLNILDDISINFTNVDSKYEKLLKKIFKIDTDIRPTSFDILTFI